ncbi:MAG: flavin-containing monooxygenase, partial [Candidatus Binatia bacterium]
MKTEYDAIVIGAGFGGLRMLHELRELGLSVHVLEAGTDVGGTWYWNRYPGARTDSESWYYCFSFDDELLQDWNWSERYPPQPEVLRYLRHVADRFEMRKDIDFATRVKSAVWDERASRWTITTDSGDRYTCRYFITAAGLLSQPYKPPIPGADSFAGETLMTARWPKEKIDFTGKRVGIIGSG